MAIFHTFILKITLKKTIYSGKKPNFDLKLEYEHRMQREET